MTIADTSHPELPSLLARLFDGTLPREEFERLEAILMQDPAARAAYQTHARVHALLYWRWHPAAGRIVESRESRVESESSVTVESGEWRVERESISGQWPVASGQGVQSRESRVESEAEFPKIPKSLNPQIPRVPIPSPLSSIPSAWAFSYAVATLLLSIALLGAWFSTFTHYDADSFVKNSRRVTPSDGTDIEAPQFTFVGKVSGMVDCQFADSSTETVAGAGVTLGRRYALKSGLMEISYDSGAKVILQGPCDYTVESRSSGFLQVGKLVARVGAGGGGRGTGDQKEERGERREESAKNQKSEIRNQKSPALTLALSGHHEVVGERGQNFTSSRLSTLNSRLFSVRTPTALVEDLGTEFGVEVSETGETTSHVFQGRVVMRTEGAGGGGRGAGDDKSEIQHPKSEILLSAGQSARIEKDAKTGEVKLLSGKKDDSSAQEKDKFVRRLREPPKQLDLLDIIAGGNGTGTCRERGIDPTIGVLEEAYYGRTSREGDGQYHSVPWSRMIDGVFVPDGSAAAVQLDSARHVFDAFPRTSNKMYGSIWSRAADAPYAETVNPGLWIYAIGRPRELMPADRGLLGMHANAGITFDLRAARNMYRDAVPSRFRAVAGVADSKPVIPEADGSADLWVFVDGMLKWQRIQLRPADGPQEVDVELEPGDRFLTLVTTDGGRERCWPWAVFGDPTLELQMEDEARGKEVRGGRQ